MDEFAKRAIERNKRLNKRQSQVVTGHWLENSLIVDVVQIQISRRIPAKVNPRQQRHPGTETLNVSSLATDDIAGFTLLNQTFAKIRPKLKGIVSKKTRER